jgi:hypothetical protein
VPTVRPGIPRSRDRSGRHVQIASGRRLAVSTDPDGGCGSHSPVIQSTASPRPAGISAGSSALTPSSSHVSPSAHRCETARSRVRSCPYRRSLCRLTTATGSTRGPRDRPPWRMSDSATRARPSQSLERSIA